MTICFKLMSHILEKQNYDNSLNTSNILACITIFLHLRLIINKNHNRNVGRWGKSGYNDWYLVEIQFSQPVSWKDRNVSYMGRR